jgi:ADP-heptose:LPS heptosyltransferase
LINQTTLLQLIWLIRAARFTVSVDSGPMHIASALSERLVSIHTWSDPRRVGPYNPEAWIWKGGDLLRVRELQSAPKRHRSKRAFKMSDVDKLMPLLREHLGRSP